MTSTVNIKQSGKGYLIEITGTPIDQVYAVTRDELEQIVLFGKIVLEAKNYDPYTCGKCGRKLSPWINPKTGKQEEYSWYCYKCGGKGVLSIG